MKSVNLNFLEPCGPLRACNGIALPLHNYIALQHCALIWYCWSRKCLINVSDVRICSRITGQVLDDVSKDHCDFNRPGEHERPFKTLETTCVTFQKNWIFNDATVRTSNLREVCCVLKPHDWREPVRWNCESHAWVVWISSFSRCVCAHFTASAACRFRAFPSIIVVMPRPVNSRTIIVQLVAMSPWASKMSPPVRVKRTPNTSLDAFNRPEDVPSGMG